MSLEDVPLVIKNIVGTVLVYLVWSWLNHSYDPMTWNGFGLIVGFLIVAKIWYPDDDDD